ncbi:MAG: sulfotransferase [Myxococcota bacterium]
MVIGVPRSGTTLLASMIGVHPDAAILIEDVTLAFTSIVGKQVTGNKLCVPNQIEMVRRATLLTRILNKVGFSLRWPTARYSIMEHLRLEGSQIIGIIRNPHDVVASIMRRGKQSRAEAIYRWTRGIEILNSLVQQVPDRILIVAYESLVREPERTMRGISSFLDLRFDSVMLEGFRHNPIYPGQSSLDASRASNARMTPDANVPSDLRQVFGKYEELVAKSVEHMGSHDTMVE